MTDQNSQFFAILTAVGEAKQANANALGVPWTFAQMGVGDANNTEPVPSRTQTRLINERRRAALNQISVDPKNSNIIIAEQVIPPDEGGWWIREIGLYDATGDLVAVANCAPSFKPLLSQGTGKTQVVRLNLIVTSTANVQLKIDPAVVLATRDYVDTAILSVLPKDKVAGTYTKVTVNERGLVQQGYNPTTLAGFGITDGLKIGDVGLCAKNAPLLSTFRAVVPAGFYLAYGLTSAPENPTSEAPPESSGILSVVAMTPRPDVTHYLVVQNGVGGKSAWFGQYNIYDNSLRWDRQLTLADRESMMVEIEKKAAKATTLAGYGITDGAPKHSPILTGTPLGPTPVKFDNSKLLATTEFVRGAQGSFAGRVSYGASTELTAADVGKLVMLNYAGSVMLPPVAGLPEGAGVALFNWGASPITVLSSPNTVMNTGTGSLPSFVLAAGTSVTFALENPSSWVAKSGDGALPFSPLFSRSQGVVSGYYKFPSGLIVQTGVASGFVSDGTFAFASVTFPITFPNRAISAFASSVGAGVSCAVGLSTYNLSITNSTHALADAYWIAFGF